MVSAQAPAFVGTSGNDGFARIEGAGADVVFRRLDFAGFRDGDGMDYVALVLDAAALTVEDCVFRDNGVVALDVRGAAALAVTASLFVANSERAVRGWYGGDIRVSASTFLSNSMGDAKGGALYAHHSPNVTLLNCTFANNSAANDGGAVFVDAARVDGTAAGDAHAVLVAGSTFASNRCAGDGGAVAVHDTAVVAFANSTFTGNIAAGGGGAVLVTGRADAGDASAARVGACAFSGNAASGGKGGALHVSRTDLRVAGAVFSENRNLGTHGGALSVGSNAHPSTFRVERSAFRGNAAAGQGGAVYLFECNGTFAATNFTSNSASGDGGAVLKSDQGHVVFEGARFDGNAATEDDGGAVKAYGGNPSSRTGTTSLTAVRSTFTSNKAVRGGAIAISKENLHLVDVDFAENGASNQGGAFWANNAAVSIRDAVFRNNVADASGQDLRLQATDCDVSCSPTLFNTSDSVSANGASDVAVDDAGCD